MLHIYGSPLSSPTNKVRYVVNYLDVPNEFHIINVGAGEHGKLEFLKINPFGKIPAIDDNGFMLAESNAIIRYLADKQQSVIYPRDLQQRALVDQWIDYASQHIALATSKIMLNTYFYKLFNIEKDERSLQDARHFLGKYIPVVEQQLSYHEYITGKLITLADFALLSALDVCEMSQVDLPSYSHISAWRKKLMSELFYQACHENYAATYNKIMAKASTQTT
jgi:glutathione S-transferase